MKYILRIFFCLFSFLLHQKNISAQCCSLLNDQLNQIGSINTFYPAPANITVTSGSISIPLNPVPQVDQFGNSYGLMPITAGDLVLIIQIQGADFNSINSNLYGANSASSGPDGLGGTGFISNNFIGQYEFVIAENDVPLTGGILQINGECSNGGLLNTYVNSLATNVSGQNTFQIIRVPRFNNLTLSQDITTTAWNGSVGGVLSFFVFGDFNLNGHTVSVKGKGFRGGYQNVRPSGASVSDYSTTNNNLSSGKGEGICGTPRFLWNGANQVDYGVNWVGYPGGNYGRGAPGNAGGGGNVHNAGGGGGAGYGSGGVGGNSYDAPATWPNGGRPGLGIPFNNDRLFFGGGGGGGDANNALTGVKGGAGGGIIFIKAGEVIGNGTLNASGTDGQVGVFASAPDGAGGGGGGGGIFFISESNSNTANIILNANAGFGGNTLNDGGNPHGPGGGGGGGRIFYALQGATVSSTVNLGNSGITNNGTDHGASNGQPGIVSTIDQTVLGPNLSIIINPFPVANFALNDICEDEPFQFFDLSYAPITNGTVIQTWNWNFGDGAQSNLQNPVHTFFSPGSYSVTLIISTNYGCKDTIIIAITRIYAANFTIA